MLSVLSVDEVEKRIGEVPDVAAAPKSGEAPAVAAAPEPAKASAVPANPHSNEKAAA